MNNKDRRKRGRSKDSRKKKKLEPIATKLNRGDLIGRLNDKGFSHYTMPSVNRPLTKNSHARPMSCKLYSLNNNLTKEKKQKQSSVLFNIEEQSYLSPGMEQMVKSNHPAFMFTSEQFYKKRGQRKPQKLRSRMAATNTHIGFKADQIREEYKGASPGPKSVNPEELIQKKFGFTATDSMASVIPGSKAYKGMKRERLVTPITIFDGNNPGPDAYKSGMEFYPKPEFPEHIKKSLKTAGNFYNANQVDSQEQDSQLRHSKLIINKLRGKYEDDHMPEEPPQDAAEKPGKESGSFGEDKAAFIKESFGGYSQSRKKAEEEEFEKNFEMNDAEDDVGNELDAYIDLILKNNSNVDEFVYLTPIEGSNNPYKLKLSDFKNLGGKSKPGSNSAKKMPAVTEYYTISGKGLCHYKNGKPVEFIGLTNWLKERETFKQIQSLQFFQKFRKWKTLEMWKRSCQIYKRNHYTKSLEEKLFISDQFLKKALYEHRSLCYDMSGLKFIDLKTKGDSGGDVIKLYAFSKNQKKKRNQVQDDIKEYSSRCRQKVKDGFKDCLNFLESDGFSKKENDNIGKQENQNFFRIKETAYERLGFGNNLNYDQRSQIRQLCMKFLRFSFLIDFLALDALRTIYMSSVVELREQLQSLTYDDKPKILSDSEKGKSQYGGVLPMFKIEVEFIEHNPAASPQIEPEPLEYFNMPPEATEPGPEKFRHFNVLGHPFLIDFSDCVDSMAKIERRQVEEFNDKKGFYVQRVVNIHKMWLKLQPNMRGFYQEIQKIFTQGMNSLLCFERWSRHPEMEPYSSILEDWDDQIGDGGDAESNTILSPTDWVDQEFQQTNETTIKNLLQKAFDKANNYLKVFSEYLQIYWEYKNLDFDKLMDEALAKPRITIKSLLMVNQFHTTFFDTKIPYQADIGLLRIDSSKFKEAIKPFPETVIKKLKEYLPVELRRRMELLTQWIKDASSQLNVQDGDEIKAFVTLKRNLEHTEREFPLIKERIKFVGDLYLVVKTFQIEAKKEDYLNHHALKNLERNLATEIMNKNNEMTKSQKVVAKVIKNEKVPELKKSIERLDGLCDDEIYLSEKSDVEEMIERLTDYWDELQTYIREADELNGYEMIVHENDDEEFTKTEFETLSNLKMTLKSKKTLWESLKYWTEKEEGLLETPITEIDFKEQLKECENAGDDLKTCRKTIQGDNPKLRELEKMIKRFERTMKVVESMRNEDLKTDEKANKNIFNLLGREQVDYDQLTLEDLFEMNVAKYQIEIGKLSKQVTKEKALEEEFRLNVVEPFKKFKILLKPHSMKDQNTKDPIYILDKQGQMVDDVDKFLTDVNNIYSNKYLEKEKKKVEKQRERIINLSVLLDQWIKFQAQWIYLEKIFNSPDFKKELKEPAKFETINKKYKKLAKNVNNNPETDSLFKKGSNNTKIAQIQEFKLYNEELNEINKNINDFLDKKREELYRLHFVSNEEMIIILARSTDPKEVQGFIGKLFENINKLDFIEDIPGSLGTDFKGLISREGETLAFKTPLSIKENIQSWMPALEKAMLETLKANIQEGFGQIVKPEERENFYSTGISQVICVVHQVFWTLNAQDAIDDKDNDDALYEWYVEIEKNLRMLTGLVRSGLESFRHKSVVVLVTQEVHNRDITWKLYEEGIQSSSEFGWQQQLRYEYSQDDTLTIRQINASFNYGYEYLGPTSRLVITPLTDRCWITITSALHLGLGAAPTGPAGTGKTESTKDLSKALGRFCIVFNCSEQIDYFIMERLFRGIIYQGAWTCLDEFNRIDIEVLSVIAQQLLDLHIGMIDKSGSQDFYFVGKLCKLNRNCGVFITMNPSTKGYAGRQKLPDNLKVLFRPVAMMIPDYRMIAEILLLSQGFIDSKNLSGKMEKLYKLSSEQLSQQKHYDFGMRAVKSVLVMAGILRRQNPEEDEKIILIRAMKDANLPKFLKDDLILFKALVRDLFPGVAVPGEDYSQLDKAISTCLKTKKLEHEDVDGLKNKVTELFKTINVRFGVMVVGAAMVGKSTCITTLQDSMTYLREKHRDDNRYNIVDSVFINPKSVTMGEFYGEENELTKDWQDGLASHYIREGTNNVEEGHMKWIVFDGPVDTLWIESLNSVLDDSRLLCLANGQRIRLGSHMRLLFEVGDLNEASPATVSRCGMVFMSEDDLGWQPILKKWFKEKIIAWKKDPNDPESEDVLPEEMQKFVWDKIEDGLDEVLKRTSRMNKEPIETLLSQKIRSFCDYMNVYLDPENGYNVHETNKNSLENILTAALALSMAWAFGGPAYEMEQDFISVIVREKFYITSEDPLYNLYLDYEENEYKNWKEKMERIEYPESITYYEMVVPTIDIVKTSYVIKALFRHERNVFLTGQSGVGKSVVAQALFKDKDAKMYFNALSFIFSAKTDTNQTQETILAPGNLEENNKYLKIAKPGMKNVIVVDDINMPAVEEFGAQPPIELLRMLIDYKYLYEKRDKYAIHFRDLCMFAVAAPPGGGRSQLTQRFTRHFNVVSLSQPSDEVLKSIFDTILSHFMRKYHKKVQETTSMIVSDTIKVYKSIKEEKLPIPAKFHYNFNLRDVSKVFMGMTQSSSEKIKTPDQLLRLWIHESTRVFHDRLINEEDKEWFRDKVAELIKKGSVKSDPEIFEKEKIFGENKIRFSGIMFPGIEDMYEDIKDGKKLVENLKICQDDYNDEPSNLTKLKLVFFEEAVDHLLRIYRLLNLPRGNAMLIGIGGLGKKSLTKLASSILNYKMQELELPGKFRFDTFKAWLRSNVLEECAGAEAEEGRPLTFFL